MSSPLDILAFDHVGIRVADAARAEAFYAKLGFEPISRHEEGRVVILRNARGLEINLIVNADPAFEGTNVLMDGPPKRAGYTHIALQIGAVEGTLEALQAHGIEISEGPVPLGGGTSIFVRDPDRNVIELRNG